MTDRPGEEPRVPDEPAVEDDPTVPPEHRPIVPPALREPVDLTFESPGQPEREMRDLGEKRSRRRARRSGTNPGADTSPDTPSSRPPAPEGEDARDRWLREQRPPHWE